MSTFPRFKGLGVKLPAAIAITNMSDSVSKKVTSVSKEKKTVFAARQPGKPLGHRKIKQG
ncbi:MAG: hypothetical protein GY696_20845 [Gammaproteobacteria bacterium]|nr:hypothetical protein [Gammaproteobacteria bacterium]